MNKSGLFHRNTKFIIFVLLVILLTGIGRLFNLEESSFKPYLVNMPAALSGIIFVMLYVVLTTLIWLGPKDILRIFAGLYYGALLSTGLIWISEMINAVILFSLSRKLGREFVKDKLKGRMKRIDGLTEVSGYWWIFMMRVFLVPFRFMDIGFGLTKIPISKYLIIIFIASPIRIFLFQYLISLGKEVYTNPQRLAEVLSHTPFLLQFSFGYLIGAVIFMFIFKRRTMLRARKNT